MVFVPLPSAEIIRSFPSPASNSINPREIENTIFVRAIDEVRNRLNMGCEMEYGARLLLNGPFFIAARLHEYYRKNPGVHP